ncbi:hypothetical protein [Bradyrhizobium sp. F1.13.3]|uniref:hypothetical protein n=1 Tax=Bradyrhizobium sp. F1.13.3 TaxID=3156351 RepID=UPI003397A231
MAERWPQRADVLAGGGSLDQPHPIACQHRRQRVQVSALVQRRSGEAINVVSEGFGPGDVAGYRRSPRPLLAAVSSMNALGLSKSQLETLIGGCPRMRILIRLLPGLQRLCAFGSRQVGTHQVFVDRGQLIGTGQMSKIF